MRPSPLPERPRRPILRIPLLLPLLPLLVLLPLLASCTHNPVKPAAGWSASKSENVTVYTSTRLEHRFPQEWLELSYGALHASFFAQLPRKPIEAMYLQVEPGSLSRVYWPNDNPPDAYMLEKMPGQGKIGRDGLIVLTSRDPREAAQQIAHKLIADDLPNAPLWLQVGFSRYLAGVRIHYTGDKWFACYGPAPGRFWPPPGCRDPGACVAGRAALIPVQQLLSADWTKYDKNGRYWYEYTAFALVSYLLHGKDRFHASRYFVFLAALRQGKSDRDAFLEAYPHILFEELDGELERFAFGNGNRQRLPVALPHGFCRKIPPAPNADQIKERVAVSQTDIQDAFDDFERLPLFRGHAGFYPRDVVDAEAAKRPPKAPPAPKPQVPGTKPSAPTDDLELRDTGTPGRAP